MNRIEFLIIVFHAFLILDSFADDDEEIFRDYCRPGLCRTGDGTHTGCKDGVLHDGKFQEPPCKPGTSKLLNLTQDEKDLIVDWHNYQRNFVACGGLMDYYHFKPACRMGAVKWDKELEATAYLHVTYCHFKHDKCRSTLKYPYSGQNLGWYETKDPNFDHKTTIGFHTVHWYIEYQDVWEEVLYNYTSKPTYPKIGHFLNSLHEKNTRLGCALAYVFELKHQIMSSIFTCNYAFINIVHSPTYSYCKEPASKCETGTDPKYPYLCSTDEKYVLDQPAQLFPYTGDGTETYECGVLPEIVQNVPPEHLKERTTLKPGTKPGKPGSKPSGKPGRPVPGPPSKPSDKPIDDYEDSELDPHHSGSIQIWKECFKQKMPKVALILLAIKII